MALGLVTFCVVALLGLLSTGLRQERTSSEQTLALEALNAVAADLQVPANYALPGAPRASKRFGITAPNFGQPALKSTVMLDERGMKTTTPGQAAFKVWYEIYPPTTVYGYYTIYLCAAPIAGTATIATRDLLKGKDFVETVISLRLL